MKKMIKLNSEAKRAINYIMRSNGKMIIKKKMRKMEKANCQYDVGIITKI